MKKILIIPIIVLTLSNCEKWIPESEYVTRHYDTREINHLFVNDNIDVTIVPDHENRVEITAPENLIDDINFYVEADSLRLRNENKHNWLYYDDSIHVTVYFGNRLTSINSNGTGHIRSTGQLTAFNLLLYAWEGSGLYKLDVNVLDQLRIIAHSKTTTDFFITGRARVLSSNINGRGTINTTDMDCSDVGIVHSGPNNLFIRADHRLRVRLASSGNIYYAGNPSSVVQVNPENGTGHLIALDTSDVDH